MALHVWEPGIEPADRKEPRTSDMKHKESDTDRGGKVEAKEKQENETMQKGREKQIWNKSQMPADCRGNHGARWSLTAGGHDHASSEHWYKTKWQVMRLIKVEFYKKLFWNKQF